MSTYLLTWKPKRSGNEYLGELVAIFKRGVPVEDSQWSCGNNQHILIGDRVFLLRQGNHLPGIVGSGWVTKGSFQAPSWEIAKQKKGIKAWHVMIEWDEMVLPEHALSRDQLLKGILPATLLKAAASGVTVKAEFTVKLEHSWAAHIKKPLKVSRIVQSGISALEGEPIEHRGYRRKRDQRLRRAAMDASQGICETCVTDFTKVLAGKGVRALQVHHRRQLSEVDEPKLNSVKDLAVVCANCHALLHWNPKKALSVSQLKSMLKKTHP
jgi:hypothetical protein